MGTGTNLEVGIDLEGIDLGEDKVLEEGIALHMAVELGKLEVGMNVDKLLAVDDHMDLDDVQSRPCAQ